MAAVNEVAGLVDARRNVPGMGTPAATSRGASEKCDSKTSDEGPRWSRPKGCARPTPLTATDGDGGRWRDKVAPIPWVRCAGGRRPGGERESTKRIGQGGQEALARATKLSVKRREMASGWQMAE